MEREARRKAILKTAAQLFSEKSFYEVTVDDIAEQVGLSKGTIYLYFENKDALFYSIMIEKTEEMLGQLNAAIECQEPFNVCLYKFVYSFLTFFGENKDYYNLSHSAKWRMNAEEHFKFHDYTKELFHTFFEMIRKLIMQGQKEKILRQADTETMTTYFAGILNPFIYYRILGKISMPVEKEVPIIIDLFINGAHL